MHYIPIGMAGKRRMNDASKFRYIQRRVFEVDPDDLLREIERIRDPYFRSLSLVSIASSKRFGTKRSMELLSSSFNEANKVDQEWRRAELISLIMKRLKKADRDIQLSGEKSCIVMIEEMKPGSGLSQAIKGLIDHSNSESWPFLIERAFQNKGFEKTDVRNILKAMKRSENWQVGHDLILKRLGSVEDTEMRVALYGALHLRSRKRKGTGTKPLELALDSMKEQEGHNASRSFSFLCSNCIDIDDLPVLESGMEWFKKPEDRIKAICDLVTASDKAGNRDMAREYVKMAIEGTENLSTDILKASSTSLIASGVSRLGDADHARTLFDTALGLSGNEEMLKKRIEAQMENCGSNREKKKKEGSILPISGKRTRHILALYDTYEGGLKPVHSRTVARAAPLCAAFDLDLALMGFPSDDLDRIIELVSKETNIGKGGAYLNSLHKEGRVYLVKCTGSDPPGDWSGLGLPVATTSKPARSRSIMMKDSKKLSSKEHPLKRVCLIMGLGRKGLPRSLLDKVPYHLEITGSGVPLETATAMGILAYMLGNEE